MDLNNQSSGLVRVTPFDGPHLCGYYDVSPWDATGRYLLTVKVPWVSMHPASSDPSEIQLIHLEQQNSVRVLAETHSCNTQQGCMLQWLGPDFARRVIFNDFRDGTYCSVILDVFTGESKVLPLPVYAVSPNGAEALSLNFSRLHRMRPGYGYCNIPDTTASQLCPDEPCVWHMNLVDGAVKPILRYGDLISFEHRDEMDGAEHKVNHIMINPSGDRFMVLHRWLRSTPKQAKYTRLLTVKMDGSGLFNLSDDDMVSHCCWKDDNHILSWARKHGTGDRYILFTDGAKDISVKWDGVLMTDGHCSYSPDGRFVVTDTYPDGNRTARVFVIDAATDEVREATHVFCPPVSDESVRCDLHPRWNRDGRAICIDASFADIRQSYVAKNPFCE